MANVVRFGLSNVHYAIWNDEQSKFETPVRIPGAVSLSLSREGQNNVFHADNVPFYSNDTNSGYSGTLTVASVADQVLTDLVGYIKDDNGLVVEDANGIQKTFALLYEVSSNEEPQRFAFYNCTLSRPEQEANTKTDTTDPDTQALAITMIPRDFTHDGVTISAVKGHITKTTQTEAKYNAFMSAVMTPFMAAA